MANKKYKNVKGSGNLKDDNCGSWKQHWMKISGEKWPTTCCVKGCTNEATDGAHIHEVGDKKTYIIPMCKEHNNPDNEDEFEINAITPVPANIEETCGANKKVNTK